MAKLKAAISRNAPGQLLAALASVDFVTEFLVGVVGECLGVENPTERPAEYYAQEPDATISIGDHVGVELRLTGVSRGTRDHTQFHDALVALHSLAARYIAQAIKGTEVPRVQLFVVIMLDGDVPLPPVKGQSGTKYTSVLEHDAEWIEVAPT